MTQSYGSWERIAGLQKYFVARFFVYRAGKVSVSMFDALKDIACFVTGFVSFLYGTRIAWMCGIKCQFSESTENRAQMLVRSIPSSALIYFFGFLILFSSFISGFFSWIVFSVTSSIILSVVVVSMAMPELKNRPVQSRLLIPVELTDGSKCQMDKRALNVSLESGVVAKFKRASGWVVVGSDQLRSIAHNTIYSGVDRRQVF